MNALKWVAIGLAGLGASLLGSAVLVDWICQANRRSWLNLWLDELDRRAAEREVQRSMDR